MPATEYRIVPLNVVLPLRQSVFFPGKSLRAATNKADASARHIAGFDAQKRVVAMASIYTTANQAERLRFLATDPLRRGEGLAAGLLQFLLRRQAERPGGQLVLHARAELAAFYTAHGFVAEPCGYQRRGVEYRVFRAEPQTAS